MVLAKDKFFAHQDSSKKIKPATNVLSPAFYVQVLVSVLLVLKDSSCLYKIEEVLFAKICVEMVEDLNLIVMMVTLKIKMVVHLNAKLKMAIHVKEDQA